MTRTTYVLRGGELVEKHLAPPLNVARDAPMIRPDGMAPIRSMADGRVYESRSLYYDSVRRAGCEIVGDERAAFDRRHELGSNGVAHDLKIAIEQLRHR